MSTRKLIALALGCALVILLAGGIQLVLLSNSDTPRVEALSPGQSAQVGDQQVSVLSTIASPGALRLTVSLKGPGDLESMAKERFAVRARERLLPVVADQSSCQQSGTEARCELVFDTGDTSLTDAFVVYRGAEASWALSGT